MSNEDTDLPMVLSLPFDRPIKVVLPTVGFQEHQLHQHNIQLFLWGLILKCISTMDDKKKKKEEKSTKRNWIQGKARERAIKRCQSITVLKKKTCQPCLCSSCAPKQGLGLSTRHQKWIVRFDTLISSHWFNDHVQSAERGPRKEEGGEKEKSGSRPIKMKMACHHWHTPFGHKNWVKSKASVSETPFSFISSQTVNDLWYLHTLIFSSFPWKRPSEPSQRLIRVYDQSQSWDQILMNVDSKCLCLPTFTSMDDDVMMPSMHFHPIVSAINAFNGRVATTNSWVRNDFVILYLTQNQWNTNSLICNRISTPSQVQCNSCVARVLLLVLLAFPEWKLKAEGGAHFLREREKKKVKKNVRSFVNAKEMVTICVLAGLKEKRVSMAGQDLMGPFPPPTRAGLNEKSRGRAKFN